MVILDEVNEVVRGKFGTADTHAYFSPGRVNLIGKYCGRRTPPVR